jgi:hypothetical protein
MDTTLFRSAIVWTNLRPPEATVLDQALRWAGRFHIPIEVVLADPSSSGDGHDGALVRSFVEKCDRQHLPCVLHQAQAVGPVAPELLGSPDDLLVFGPSLRSFLDPAVHDRRLCDLAPATLQCTGERKNLSHVLILDEGRRFTHAFLCGLVELCQSLEASPVVLTLAASEAAGQRRQERLQAEAAAVGLRAQFDVFVGHDPCAAVARVARWRHCGVVVRQRRGPSPWWKWLHRDALEGLTDLDNGPALLELPDRWEPHAAPALEPAHERLVGAAATAAVPHAS